MRPKIATMTYMALRTEACHDVASSLTTIAGTTVVQGNLGGGFERDGTPLEPRARTRAKKLF